VQQERKLLFFLLFNSEECYVSVKIRLARGGRKKIVKYRVVVSDSRSARDGRFLETLGWYNPQEDPKQFSIKVERVAYWLKLGAELSLTIKNLMKQDNMNEKIAALEKGLSLESAAIKREPERKRKPKKHKSQKGVKASAA
jgi:small subunit ribosomal protein S16